MSEPKPDAPRPAKTVLPPAPRPYFLITNLHVAMLQRLEKDLRPLGVTPAAGRVLNAIARRPEISSADLAKMFGISPQSIKQTIATLETGGLIERRAAEADRRVRWNIMSMCAPSRTTTTRSRPSTPRLQPSSTRPRFRVSQQPQPTAGRDLTIKGA